MRIIVKWHEDMWQEIKDDALFTIHKSNGKYPDEKWKKQMLLAEHSPIRTGRLIVECFDVPSFVIGHLVRHNVGFTPFVSSLRSDRADYNEVPNRNTPNNVRFDGNFQSFINISRKRFCNCASAETREFWHKVMKAVKEFEPELYWACVPECIYRGGCSEMFPCKEHFFAEFLNYVGKDNLNKLFNVSYRYDKYKELIGGGSNDNMDESN